jgi:PKD repeat protein
MRRLSIVLCAAVIAASTFGLVGLQTVIQARDAAAHAGKRQAAVGSWLLTFSSSHGGQSTPVLFTLHSDGTLLAGELPVAAGALLPAPSGSPSASQTPSQSQTPAATQVPSPSVAPSLTEPPPSPTEPSTSSAVTFNSPGQGVWSPSGDSGFAFSYVVLQSDPSGNFVAQVTVSGSAAPDPVTAEARGNYTMRFAGPDGQDLGTSTGTLEGDPINQDLVASFDTSTRPGTLRVTFTDTSSGNPTDWQWDFGDGSNTGVGPHPIHVYAQPGDYTVFLSVSNGQEDSSQAEIITVGQPTIPQADFSSQATDTLEITFTDESSGRPSGWSWDFGDGGTSTRANPTHTYDKPGDYKVTLTVGNENGSDTRTKTVTVVAPPTADFSTSQTPGSLQIQFTDDTSGSPAVWAWEFGDGRFGNKQNPTHTYRNPGTYQVTLTVFNGGGRDRTTKAVTVRAQSPTPSGSASP